MSKRRALVLWSDIICEFLMGLISKVRKNNISVKEQELKFKKHNKHQKSCRCFLSHLESKINPIQWNFFFHHSWQNGSFENCSSQAKSEKQNDN
jgi:hypothetical protein